MISHKPYVCVLLRMQGYWPGLEAAESSASYLSVLTLGEIRKKLTRMPLSKRRTGLETWLETELRERFRDRVLAIDEEVAGRWGLLAANAKKNGKALSVIDGLLAATANQHNLTIVSRNVSDFADASS